MQKPRFLGTQVLVLKQDTVSTFCMYILATAFCFQYISEARKLRASLELEEWNALIAVIGCA